MERVTQRIEQIKTDELVPGMYKGEKITIEERWQDGGV